MWYFCQGYNRQINVSKRKQFSLRLFSFIFVYFRLFAFKGVREGRHRHAVRRIAPRGVENGLGHWPLSSTSRFNL
jgi:hypothetical protein